MKSLWVIASRNTPPGLKWLAIASLAVGLTGCANIANTPPGTPASQVVQQFGAPTVQCPTANGGTRMLWSGQPFRQVAWAINVDASGKTGPVQAVLTDKHFQVLRDGVWTPERLLCEFGPPAEKSAVGLPSVRQIVWSYRYMQDGVWYSLMHVYLGRDGERVTRFHPGPDPMYERDRFMFD